MPSPAQALVGTWRLLSCEHELADGRRARPFGAAPVGRLVYGADGRMSVMLMDPGRLPARSAQLFEASDAELSAAARGFVAYSGKWRVEGHWVVHEVDVSLFPNWVGTSQVRAFALEGRRLSLSTRRFAVRGEPQTARLVWEREG